MLITEPVLWRGPGELQVGVASPRVLRDLTAAEMDLIQHLTSPRSPEWLAREVGRAGIRPARWTEIRTALADEPATHVRARGGPVLLLDAHPLTVQVGHLLGARATRIVSAERGRGGASPDTPRVRPALAVLTDAWVTDPVRIRPLLRHDVPHLPLVVDDGVTVGPVVTPGSGPCTMCLELARTDADPAWPAVATQLRVLPARAVREPDLAASLAAWVAADFLCGASPHGWRLASGTVLPIRVEMHPRCGCVRPPSGDAPGPS